MIVRGSIKPLPFINGIGRHISPGEWRDFTSLDAALSRGDEVYIGAGYWRMILQWNVQDDDSVKLDGAILVNPDKNRADIAIVERAVAILTGAEYNPA
jgi:hypothetical protein